MPLHLSVRTPEGLLVDDEVQAISAEDEGGWFGILPGRTDLIAVLPPGLLSYRKAQGERFVALSGGLLELRRGHCRVMAREAKLSERLEDVADALLAARLKRRQRGQQRRGALRELEREALRRLSRQAAQS